jgi:hypothetical protein
VTWLAVAYVGLSWSFGGAGKRRAKPAFDFGGQ